MSRVRIYDLAKELGVPSKRLMEALKELGVEAKAASSSIDETTAQAAKELLSQSGAPAPAAAEAKEEVATEPPAASAEAEEVPGVGEHLEPITLLTPITVAQFAHALDTEPPNIVAAAEEIGETLGEAGIILPELAVLIGEKWGYAVTVEEGPAPVEVEEAAAVLEEPTIDKEAAAEAAKRALPRRPPPPPGAPPRPPIVTVMGHVDHGKTTLLDTIRKTRVTASEAGGITQHIGAYQVEVAGKLITFIDTPGHKAFTSMRARGAQVTDIAVLVVAADDGIMPQTREAVAHAKAAGVPIIVAINKIDRADASVDKVRQQLTEVELTPEEWGGDTICVPISALQGTGVQSLLEMILLVAELQELAASRESPAGGVVLESELDRRKGPVATILVHEGVLRVGDAVIVGAVSGKIRAMTDYLGQPVKEAPPSTPVSILGLSAVPKAGETLAATKNERQARTLAEQRGAEDKVAAGRGSRVSLQDFFAQSGTEERKVLRVVLKTDVQGTIDAIRTSLEQLATPEVGLEIIYSAAGDVSESDVMLAAASRAVIIGFQVDIEAQARRSARDQQVDVRVYQVIYDLIDDVQQAMVGLLEAQYEERVLGRAEVRAVFKSSRYGTIAGCRVSEGSLVRGATARVMRGGKVVHEGKLDSLRHVKEDVSDIGEGYECGLVISGYNDFEAGDIVEAVTLEEVRRLTL